MEGPRAVQQGLSSGGVPLRVAYTSRALATSPPTKAVLSALPAGTALVEMDERVLGGIADTVHSQGVIAAFPIPAWSPTPADLRDRLVLVLDGVSDPGNVGTLLRSAAAAGCGGVLLAPGCADRFNPKVVRASVGALFSVRSASLEWSALHPLLKHIPRRCAADAGGETVYFEAELAGGCAILVGNEAVGLGARARALATASVRIPIVGVESLNAAVAGSLLLFEAVRQRSLERPGASQCPSRTR